MATRTNNETVDARVVNVAVVPEDGADKQVLALVEREEVSLSIDEEDEDFEPATETRTRRIPTTEEVTIELGGAIDVDAEALEVLGFVDAEGKYIRDGGRRAAEVYIEYIDVDDWEAEPELVHRAEDVEWKLDGIDAESPAQFEAEGNVEGDLYLAYEEEAE